MKRFCIIIALLLASCASVPVERIVNVPAPIPDGMVLISRAELDQVMRQYIQQQEYLKDFQECREWREKMFF